MLLSLLGPAPEGSELATKPDPLPKVTNSWFAKWKDPQTPERSELQAGRSVVGSAESD